MGLVVRLGPDIAASRGDAGAGDTMSGTSQPQDALASELPRAGEVSHLVPCRHCGVLNGWTAQYCWGCEASLWKARASGSVAEHGYDASESEVLERPPNDGGGAHDTPLASQTGNIETVIAAGSDVSPVQTATHRTLANADASFPLLTSMVEGKNSVPALSVTPAPALPAGMSPTQMLQIAAVLVVTAFVGITTYLHWGTAAGDAAIQTGVRGGNAKSAGLAVGQISVAPPIARAPETGQGDTMPAAVAPRATVAVPDTPVQSQSVEPDAALRVEVGPPVPAMQHPAEVATGLLSTRSTSAAAMTATQSDKVRGTVRSANPAAADSMPKPDRFEPERPTSPPLGPCTEAVAALGLCAASPIRSKEFGWTGN